MSDKYYLANTVQISERKASAEKFYSTILDKKDRPYIVTDDASLYDIYAGDEAELINRINTVYGIIIDVKLFGIPFWQLLDFLEKNKYSK